MHYPVVYLMRNMSASVAFHLYLALESDSWRAALHALHREAGFTPRPILKKSPPLLHPKILHSPPHVSPASSRLLCSGPGEMTPLHAAPPPLSASAAVSSSAPPLLLAKSYHPKAAASCSLAVTAATPSRKGSAHSRPKHYFSSHERLWNPLSVFARFWFV
jgi:hypothetical protein